MSSPQFSSFFQEFGVDLENPTPGFNYSELVLGNHVQTFPFQVARILTTPRGPTDVQEGLIGVIVPYIVEDDIQQVVSVFSDKPLSSGSVDMKTGKHVEHTTDTLVVNPEGFVNSVLFACYYYLNNGQQEVAYKMMQYINQIIPYVGRSLIWTITPENPAKPFSDIGNITTREQLINPYLHQEEIFPNTCPPHTRLS